MTLYPDVQQFVLEMLPSDKLLLACAGSKDPVCENTYMWMKRALTDYGVTFEKFKEKMITQNKKAIEVFAYYYMTYGIINYYLSMYNLSFIKDPERAKNAIETLERIYNSLYRSGKETINESGFVTAYRAEIGGRFPIKDYRTAYIGKNIFVIKPWNLGEKTVPQLLQYLKEKYTLKFGSRVTIHNLLQTMLRSTALYNLTRLGVYPSHGDTTYIKTGIDSEMFG